jgi:hypothetical protein
MKPPVKGNAKPYLSTTCLKTLNTNKKRKKKTEKDGRKERSHIHNQLDEMAVKSG